MSKKRIYTIHKWLGLTVGALMFLFGLSGVAITFRHELMPKVYPSLFFINPQEKSLPLDQLVNKTANYLGADRYMTNLYASEDPDEAFMVLVKDPKVWLPVMVTINQYTGEIVGEMGLVKNFFAVMLFMHSNLFMGKIGSYIVGILGLILLFFVLSGIYVWLPYKGVFEKVKKILDFKKHLLAQKAHHLMGLLFALPLAVSAITGFLTIYDVTYQVGRHFTGDPVRVEEIEKPVGVCELHHQLSALSHVTPEMMKNLISVHFCTKKSALMKVTYGLRSQHFLDGYGRILIDPATNQVIQEINSDKDPKSWNFKRLFIYPIHSGEYFGMAGRIIVLISGIGLMILFISGIILYLRRRKKDA